MKQKLFITAVLLISAMTTFSQNSTSFGVNVGYDQNMYLNSNLLGTVSNELPDISIGADITYYIGEKMRLRTELRYSNISFQKEYAKGIDDDNLGVTKLATNNIGLVPHFDYKLFSLGKLDLYSTAGLRFEITLDDYYRSYTVAGERMSQDYYNSYFEKHASTMLGATAGFLFKLNLGENTALTLSPEYTGYFWKYYDKNDKALQRASLNIGLEWKF